MFERFYLEMLGCLQVSVTGPQRITFLNKCTSQGIPLWSVRAYEDELRLYTSIQGFRRMRKAASETRSRVEVVARRGAPFVVQRLRRRTAFTLGALSFLLLVWALSSFVWFIDVEGSELVEDSCITNAIAQQGLYVGVLRAQVEQDKIAEYLLRQFPELVWASVSLKGSRATVKVVDRVMVEPSQRSPGDVVAEKPGLLVKLIATGGQAVSAPGETVVKGQVLISGSIVVDAQLVTQTRAEGLALARVWYEVLASAQLRRQTEHLSGYSTKSDILRVGSTTFIVAGPASSPYEYSQAEEVKRILLPGVEHISIAHREIILEAEDVSEEVALREAVLDARNKLQELLPPGSEIITEQVEHRLLPDGNTLEVRILVETIENIGAFLAYALVP